MSTTDPFALFDTWYAEAREAEPNDSNAMALATVGVDGQPSVRMVLLKGHGEGSKAALLFHWKSTRRQIRIEGEVSFATDAEGDAYFAIRSRDSQLGAWASDQSRPLGSRETFEARFEEMKTRFEGMDVPRPPHWGGYRVTPRRIEFWQDRAHRLHERRMFTRNGDDWSEGLLYP
jgi:pyridoxamine 5'-phosphate oxidase